MSKINIDQKSKSIRKYAGRTIALEKQNIRTKTNRGKTNKHLNHIKYFFYNDLFWKKVGAFW
jgi:hypothetical protein